MTQEMLTSARAMVNTNMEVVGVVVPGGVSVVGVVVPGGVSVVTASACKGSRERP